VNVPRCEVAGCRNHTAEGVCVPCQQKHGLPGRPYQIPAKATAPIPTPGSPSALPTRPKSAVATPDRPLPQPHNLDAARDLPQPERSTRAVFDAICAHPFLTPHCWPSEALLAEKAGVTRMTVVRAKRWLREHGWISWERAWHKPQSRWQHCRYTILAGWHRPHRKAVLSWLDERRCRANVALNELPRRRRKGNAEK
jgi:hypothetical protein